MPLDRFLFLAIHLHVMSTDASRLSLEFSNPPGGSYPETWFHLIGGNVNETGLTADLEAIAGAGLQGIQLFHGRGGEWPGVAPQIQSLSPAWEGMIAHVGEETERLGLKFTMQNCPGWAMSGGPWITPDKAMRHLIWSRRDIKGGGKADVSLPQPEPSGEAWRDYREVAVLAFPTPLGDNGERLVPVSVRSNRGDSPWMELLKGEETAAIRIDPAEDPVWIELQFDRPVAIRSLALPPVEQLMLRRSFDPGTAIRLDAADGDQWVEIGRRNIPRGNWQDRQEEMDIVLAYPDRLARVFRITFENKHPIELRKLVLSEAARTNDWRGQAGYVLRSLERASAPKQDTRAWIDPGTILDLSDKLDEDGNLHWQAPQGNWTIIRFGHVNTGVKNQPAPPEATGFECDKLSPLGAEQHFAGYIGNVTRPGGPVEGLLDGMLIDSWECYTQTWTPAIEVAFQERRGYSLREWLPAIAGWVVEDHATSERFLRDWRKTISDLLVEHYFGRLAELGRERGLKLSFETALGDVSPGDILQYFGKADIPMCEFWHPNDPHWGGFETKPIHPAVSAAHLYGKPIVAAEAFTNIGVRWDEHPFMLKHLADRHFALGLNHLVFHTYTHNPRLDLVPGTSFGSQIGTPFLRGQTWWRHMPQFTQYLARCQFILQQGKPVADILWYLGDDLDHKPRQDTPFPAGYGFDYLNPDVLVNRLDVVDGLLQTPEGLSWKVIWLPAEQCQRLTPRTLQRLQELLLKGATVIGGPPHGNASLSGGAMAERTFANLVDELWGVPADHGDRRIGEGRLLWGDSLQETLLELGIQPDVAGTQSATWCHRSDGEREIYFIAADRISPLRANLTFRATGRPEFWDPVSGMSEPVTVFHPEAGHTRIPVELDAGGAVFVVFNSAPADPAFVAIERDGEVLVDARDASDVDTAPPYPNYGLTPGEPVQPRIEPLPVYCRLLDEGRSLLAWEPGRYKLVRPDGNSLEVKVEGAVCRILDGDWALSFPPGWDVPDTIAIDAPVPWSGLADPAIRAFSGTATYATRLEHEQVDPGTRLMLDLGYVSNIAEVLINGESVATLWASPFRVDVTDFLKPGPNDVAIRVTNTWRNRLAYDAALPEADRKTWTIYAPKPDVPVIPAGLDGKVYLWKGIVCPIGDM